MSIFLKDLALLKTDKKYAAICQMLVAVNELSSAV